MLNKNLDNKKKNRHPNTRPTGQNPPRVSALQMFQALCLQFDTCEVLDELQSENFIYIITNELRKSKKTYLI
jgi:hypothetical protein